VVLNSSFLKACYFPIAHGTFDSRPFGNRLSANRYHGPKRPTPTRNLARELDVGRLFISYDSSRSTQAFVEFLRRGMHHFTAALIAP
jgi:hypothetical protein